MGGFGSAVAALGPQARDAFETNRRLIRHFHPAWSQVRYNVAQREREKRVFSGNEWLILVLMLLAFVALVWVIVKVVRGGAGAAGLSSARVRGDCAGVLNDLQLSMSTVRGTICRRAASSVTAEWSYVPGWAVVIAVLLFPIGLVALVARTSASGTVIAESEGEGTVVLHIGGQFNKGAVRAINAVIDARS